MKRVIFLIALVSTTLPIFANGTSEGSLTAPVLEGYSSATAAGVNVQWKVEGDKLSVQVAAATTGWVAVGFDPVRQMSGASIIIGFIKDGVVNIRDDYGVRNTAHASDVSQGGTDDVTVISGEEANGGTLIRFTIPLDSGDQYDKVLVPGTQHHIIVAHGPNGADNFGTYHAERGSFDITL